MTPKNYYNRLWRLDNPERNREYQSKWRKSHKSDINAKAKIWRDRNPYKVAAYNKKHYKYVKVSLKKKPGPRLSIKQIEPIKYKQRFHNGESKFCKQWAMRDMTKSGVKSYLLTEEYLILQLNKYKPEIINIEI